MSTYNQFNKDYQLSLKARAIQDKIYKSIWDLSDIKRYERKDEVILDIKYHIDVELNLANGTKLLGQEKALRNQFSHYNTFTVEFYQNRHTKEPGEFFNLGAQFYMHGYFNKEETLLEKWVMVDLLRFLDYCKKYTIKELERFTKPSTSNASFFNIDYKLIPKELIFKTSDQGLITNAR